jgi:hypothetical protein
MLRSAVPGTADRDFVGLLIEASSLHTSEGCAQTARF